MKELQQLVAMFEEPGRTGGISAGDWYLVQDRNKAIISKCLRIAPAQTQWIGDIVISKDPAVTVYGTKECRRLKDVALEKTLREKILKHSIGSKEFLDILSQGG